MPTHSCAARTPGLVRARCRWRYLRPTRPARTSLPSGRQLQDCCRGCAGSLLSLHRVPTRCRREPGGERHIDRLPRLNRAQEQVEHFPPHAPLLASARFGLRTRRSQGVQMCLSCRKLVFGSCSGFPTSAKCSPAACRPPDPPKRVRSLDVPGTGPRLAIGGAAASGRESPAPENQERKRERAGFRPAVCGAGWKCGPRRASYGQARTRHVLVYLAV